MKYYKIIFLSALILILTSCGNTKYHYHFERGSMVDFTQGEWILNEAYTNYNKDRINKIARNECEKILHVSLFHINDLRKGRLLPAHLSFNPSKGSLEDLKTATGTVYLINVPQYTDPPFSRISNRNCKCYQER